MLILSLTVILPFLIVLAFKSEKKQAKLSHQLSEFMKDLVRTDFGSADPENNNKLLTGEGTITCDETLTDDLFEVEVESAVKLKRTVEVLQLVKTRPQKKDICGDDESRAKDKFHLSWVKVTDDDKVGGL